MDGECTSLRRPRVISIRPNDSSLQGEADLLTGWVADRHSSRSRQDDTAVFMRRNRMTDNIYSRQHGGVMMRFYSFHFIHSIAPLLLTFPFDFPLYQ